MALALLVLAAVDDLCDGDPSCLLTGDDVGPGIDDGMGFPGWFVAIGVLVAIVALLGVVYRVSLARSMARSAGLDEDDAARITLLDEDGLSATYLASQLRRPQTPSSAPPGSARDRLAELARLHADGLITDEEHAARRAAIIDQL
jgi:hypothetical protein